MTDHMCELCDHKASLYCASDSAFLCFRCDTRVHDANFLVARHVRQPICSNCKAIAEGLICGNGVANVHTLCSSCSPENNSLSSCSSFDSACSSCSSSAESSAGTTPMTINKVHQQRSRSSVTEVSGKKSSVGARLSGRFTRRRVQRLRVTSATSADARMEGSQGIFVNWCYMLGMSSGDSLAVVSSASYALGFCLSRLQGVPLRVSLAASFWFGVSLFVNRMESTCQDNLRRVEEISGVSAKLIMAVDAKLGRELRVRRARPELEEGWAES